MRNSIGAGAPTKTESTFITKTYLHLLVAVLAFTGLEIYYFQSGIAESIASAMLSANWLWSLGGFILVGWMARGLAHATDSQPLQYIGLSLCVASWSVMFVPLIYTAETMAPGVTESAAYTTLMGFAGLTAIVFWTREDFSFLRPFLAWSGVVALILIVAGSLFGFVLGTWFSVAMIALAGGSILYDTSNLLHEYGPGQHVAAALELFASVALLFWYVLRFYAQIDD